MNIPLVDLKAQYLLIKKEIDDAIYDVINNSSFIKGKHVSIFEENYKKLLKSKFCIGVANGTDSLFASLKSLGIGVGDEVITASNSWISSSETISLCGANPVFVDIEPHYFTIDTSLIENKITEKTKAIMPVHLYGHPANMTKIIEIADKYDLKIIEDCAQAHLAEWKNQLVGTFGDVGSFSFFPGKNLGAYGDAGGIITNSEPLSERIRMFANHGALIKHEHIIEGINSRLDGIQAAILNVKLKYISEWTQKRIKISNIYNKYLKHLNEITTPKVDENAKHVFHLYVVRTKKRKQVSNMLNKKGVSTAIHYPTSLPLLKAYKHLNHRKEDFPISSTYQDEILSLPMYPELDENKIKYICKIIEQEIKK